MRVCTILWHTPPPTSIDEELAVYDDGTGWLVVRRPSTDSAAVGTFRTVVTDAEAASLATAGARVDIDLVHPDTTDSAASVSALAATIATRARSTPHAVAHFYGRAVPGQATLALAVVGEGEVPVAFELDPKAAAVHFSAGGTPIAWAEVADLGTGFVTPDAEGLGGVHRRAAVGPGQMGAIVIPVAKPGGTDEIAVQVGGWLVDALPDAPERQPFEARTEPAPAG